MKDVNEFVAGICAKLADISVRSEAIKQESMVIGLEVIEYTKEVETMPQSHDRDLFVAALTRLKAALIELGAIPPMVLTAKPAGEPK